MMAVLRVGRLVAAQGLEDGGPVRTLRDLKKRTTVKASNSSSALDSPELDEVCP
jgi:hypothetical protein